MLPGATVRHAERRGRGAKGTWEVWGLWRDRQPGQREGNLQDKSLQVEAQVRVGAACARARAVGEAALVGAAIAQVPAALKRRNKQPGTAVKLTLRAAALLS